MPDIKKQQLDIIVLGSRSPILADRKEQMLREDHAVTEVVGGLGLDGCHSLMAAPARQAGSHRHRGLLSVASSI